MATVVVHYNSSKHPKELFGGWLFRSFLGCRSSTSSLAASPINALFGSWALLLLVNIVPRLSFRALDITIIPTASALNRYEVVSVTTLVNQIQ